MIGRKSRLRIGVAVAKPGAADRRAGEGPCKWGRRLARGGRVVSGNHRYVSYANYVPMRSIDKESWYTLGNGLADCWTEWTLSRLISGASTGIQRFRVNGYGTILKRWNV